MQYHSTRDRKDTVDSAQAVLSGLAPDGGLYVPQAIPQIDVQACLDESTMQMARRIISALLPDIPEMDKLVSRGYTGKFQTDELTPTVEAGPFTVLELRHHPCRLNISSYTMFRNHNLRLCIRRGNGEI